MELNPYESDLLVLHKELKRQEEEFLQSLVISYDEGVQTKSIEILKELQSSQEVIELYQKKSSSYRDELIPKEDAENFYAKYINENQTEVESLLLINNLKTGEVESTAVTRSVTETRSSQTVDTSYSLEHFPFKIGKNEDQWAAEFAQLSQDIEEHFPFKIGKNEDQWGAKFAQLSQDIEEHLKEVKTEIERSKVKQQLENYMTMLNAFQPGSSSAEATQVFISFYQRMLGSI